MEIAVKMALFVRFILLLTSQLKSTIASRHSVYLNLFAASNKLKGVWKTRIFALFVLFAIRYSLFGFSRHPKLKGREG